MLRGYNSMLDPSIDNIDTKPHVLMNIMKSGLEENREYVGYDLTYQEFKAQVNVFLKNIRHGFKLFIETSAIRPTNCPEEHWEGMKHLIPLKQNKKSQLKIVP
jgi:hypothetical protein